MLATLKASCPTFNEEKLSLAMYTSSMLLLPMNALGPMDVRVLLIIMLVKKLQFYIALEPTLTTPSREESLKSKHTFDVSYVVSQPVIAFIPVPMSARMK